VGGAGKERAAVALFISNFVNKIDAKGRVSVPSSFRAVLSTQKFPGIVVFPSVQVDKVAVGCGMDHLEKVAAASSSQLGLFSTELDDLNNVIFGESHQLAWDDTGRVVLPPEIIEHVGVTDLIAFVGNGHVFNLLHPDAFAAQKQKSRARLKVAPPSLVLGRPEET
jgi:MraZ protein